jgi:hypothetical protein
VGPCHQFLFGLDEAPCLARFSSFLTGSSEFFIFSCLVPRLVGVMFTSLLDLYRASRSCHQAFNELIPEVLLSTLRACLAWLQLRLERLHSKTLGGARLFSTPKYMVLMVYCHCCPLLAGPTCHTLFPLFPLFLPYPLVVVGRPILSSFLGG